MPDPLSETALLDALRWRGAVKRFDPARTIPDATWDALEEALRLSPSSFGLQPWKFVVVTDPAMRRAIWEQGAYQQAPVVDASHLVVLAHRPSVGEAEVDAHLAQAAKVKQVPVESMQRTRAGILRLVTEIFDKPQVAAWTARQTYIAFGVLLTSAALLGVDACPIEGIDPPEIDRLLGLTDRGFATLALCALGYRSAEETYALAPKVRYDRDVVIDHV